MTTIKAQYQNGNYVVQLWEDGTKLRLTDNLQPLSPIWPESIDIKITNMCDVGCHYCHERSDKRGRCFDVEDAYNLLKDLPLGVELAFGGGNPLCCREGLLWLFPRLHCIKNLTVHTRHLHQLGNLKPTALGVSYERVRHDSIERFYREYGKQLQVVVHLIAGVHTLDDLGKCLESFGRVLVLGYKQTGRGITFYSSTVEDTLSAWRDQLEPYLHYPGKILSFDNLAIKQLYIRRFFKKELWDRMYMGDDGLFSMYLDLVRMEFAESSTAKVRYKIVDAPNVQGMFRRIKLGKGNKEA